MTDLLNESGQSTPARVSKAEQSRRTRALLIKTAIQVLARYGYAKTTLHLIAAEAGVSRGPMHYHFKSRAHLFSALAEALPLAVSDETRLLVEAAATLRDRMHTVIDIAIAQSRGDHHIAAIELLVASREDSELSQAIAPHFAASEDALDEWWVNYAHDLNWPESKLIALRHTLIAALRGITLDHRLSTDERLRGEALAILREQFLGIMGIS